MSKEEKPVGHQERMVAPWVPDSGGVLRAVCCSLWFHRLLCRGLLLVSDFLPLSSAALPSLLRCEQTPRRQRTGWDILHSLAALERSAFLKPRRRRRGVEGCQSQAISQAGALRNTESWERRGRTARGFPWASKHLGCTATGFIITLLPRFQFSETAWF